MKQPKVILENREEAVRLSKRLTPEERLVAFFHHSQLINRLYQAGVRYRSRRKR